MRVLIAYDGSQCADDALADLSRAGLPANLDVCLVSVAEVWVAEPGDMEEGEGSVDAAAMSTRAREGLGRAGVFAESAAELLRHSHPGWNIHTRIYPDYPAWGILHVAEEWNPDLIVLGSHGRSALGRVLLGSVSQSVLHHASCSVRIARAAAVLGHAPLRIVVGHDGTSYSDAAVGAVAARVWPEGSSVHVVTVAAMPPVPLTPTFSYADIAERTVEEFGRERTRLQEIAADAARLLGTSGLHATSQLCDGVPARTLMKTAHAWGADCIFLGARGHRPLERVLLGSVAASVAARAHCSVEIVRSGNADSGPMS